MTPLQCIVKDDEDTNEAPEDTRHLPYLRHKRWQSVRQGVLNRRLQKQANMLVRQSLQPTNFVLQSETTRNRTVTFSDERPKMKRNQSIPPSTNNLPSFPRNRNTMASIEEEKLISKLKMTEEETH